MGKTSHPRFRQLDAKYRTGKFHPGIALTICTNQFHLPGNDHQGLKLVSKMALKKWNRNFCLEYSVWKTGLPFQMFRCSWKFSAGTTQKRRVPFTFQLDFVNGKTTTVIIYICPFLKVPLNYLTSRKQLFK